MSAHSETCMGCGPMREIETILYAMGDILPGNPVIICAREFAIRGLVTEWFLVQLLALLQWFDPEGQLGALRDRLQAMTTDDEHWPVDVTEIADDGQRIYRVENAKGTTMYAWLDRHGWESTGWGIGLSWDSAAPTANGHALPHERWPIGLAKLIDEAIADLDTAEEPEPAEVEW